VEIPKEKLELLPDGYKQEVIELFSKF